MDMQQLIRQDISLIMELVDGLSYNLDRLPLMKKSMTQDQLVLIEDLADVIANYRICITNPIAEKRKPLLELLRSST